MTFYEKKIKTFFSRFDTNKNGTVELDDFNQWSTRLAKERGLDAQKSSNLAKNMTEIWRFFFLPADFDHDSQIEVSEMVKYMQDVIL